MDHPFSASFLRDIWDHTDNGERTPYHRVECIIKDCRRIERHGVSEQYPTDLALDTVLSLGGLPAVLRLLAKYVEELA